MSNSIQAAPSREERIYENGGNLALVDLVPLSALVLDIGCGAGANARLVRQKYPSCEIHGLTISGAEADRAAASLDKIFLADLENGPPPDISEYSYDVVIFSHVLEHLKNPDNVVRQFCQLVKPGGHMLIAVPNILSWHMRLRFLRGKFEYEDSGVLDNTHLRFFTYFTADKFLFSKTTNIAVTDKQVTGGIPLWWLRRYLLPGNLSKKIDNLACRYFPNLFGGEIIIKARING